MSNEFEKFFSKRIESKTPEVEKPQDRHEYEDEDKELETALANIWDIAKENHLDPFPTKFDIAPPHIINQMAAYLIPGRFSHWTYGRSYRELETRHNYGAGKIYELVINSDPSQAYLLENNPPIENKFVMAHVLGHTDFFKNNAWFAETRRDMPEAAELSAARIREYEEEYGEDAVEDFLDSALAIEWHIDPYVQNRPGRDEELEIWRKKEAKRQERIQHNEKLNGKERERPVKNQTIRELGRVAINIPPEPDSDIVGFIRNHAPYLEDWQRDILSIVREQSQYLYPQKRTKIMNEGWASYWHKRIMREMGDRDLLTPAEDEAWWKVHSGVLAHDPKRFNPYYVGMKMFEYIEDYHNGNLSPKEESWLRSQGKEIHPHFEGELKDSPAAEALRDAMMYNDDQSFIRNYFDKNIADRLGMYAYDTHVDYKGNEVHTINEDGWEEIKDRLVQMLDNSDTPRINVINGDYNKSGQLHLRHEFDGRNLDPSYIDKTLPYIYNLWQRPVHLQTVLVDKEKGSAEAVVYSYDGNSIKKTTQQLNVK